MPLVRIDDYVGWADTLKIVARIEQSDVIAKILSHLEQRMAPQRHRRQRPFEARAPFALLWT